MDVHLRRADSELLGAESSSSAAAAHGRNASLDDRKSVDTAAVPLRDVRLPDTLVVPATCYSADCSSDSTESRVDE